MRVLLWDVRGGGERKVPLIERADADVMLLLGVSRSSARSWIARWRDQYECIAGVLEVESTQRRPHGAMIASRWPLRDGDVIHDLPRPERGVAAIADGPDGPVTVLSWGAPNATGDGRPVKGAAYASMSAKLAAIDGPVVIGVDTNTWADEPLGGSGTPTEPGWEAEHDFVGRSPSHGLRDIHRELVDRDTARSALFAAMRPFGPLAVTYVRRPHRSPRGIVSRPGAAFGLDRMDRLYVSEHFIPLACEHFYPEAIAAGGDHALVLAQLQLG